MNKRDNVHAVPDDRSSVRRRYTWNEIFMWLRKKSEGLLFLIDADLRHADLRHADLSYVRMNWQSHNLIAERLRQAAGDHPIKRLAAGYILASHDWCWDELISNAPHITLEDGTTLTDWALDTMREWVRDGDNAPGILTRETEVEA